MEFTLQTPNEEYTVEVQCLPKFEQMCVSTDFLPQDQPEWFSAMDHRFCLRSFVKMNGGRCVMYYTHPSPSDYAKTMTDCEEIFCDKISLQR